MSSVKDLSEKVDDIITAAFVNHTDMRGEYLVPKSPKEQPPHTSNPSAPTSPSYYVSAHQPIETMEANMPVQQFIGYLRGNIIKYACRMGKKDDSLKDARKLAQYSTWLVTVLSGEYISESNDPKQQTNSIQQ